MDATIDNQSLLDWLRGKVGRGAPTWTDKPNTGKYGGYPGWEPGMPRAPGNSPGVGRLGGTYTPSGNIPVPPVSGNIPAVGGSGVGGPPASLSGMLGNAAAKTPWINPYLAAATGLASQRDQYPSIEDIARRHQDIRNHSLIAATVQALRGNPGTSRTPQSSNGIPIPPAGPTPPALPIPNATPGNLPIQLANLKDQERVPVQPAWSGMAQTPNSLPPTPQRVPLPVARPAQSVPLPTPRPQIAQRVPMPTTRPQMPVKAPTPQMAQAIQNKSILDTLLSSFDPNAEWRKQYR